jgi:putative flippase GtrA
MFFAILATIANLGTQRLLLMSDTSSMSFSLAVGTGTIVGLGIKYLLDKRWIFYDIGTGLKSHSIKVLLSTVMGVLRTIIFWGTETVFWIMWQTVMMRELGAVLGLTVGYIVKFKLDRRFVFTDAQLAHGITR